MLSPQQLTDLAERFPRIADDAGLMHELKTHAGFASLPRGRDICHQGDRCTHLALVTAGSARVYKLAESGREITLYRVEPGECCILTASCMLSARRFPAQANAETAVDAVLVAESRVRAWMTLSDAWRHFLWDLLATRLGDVIGLVEEVAFRRMDRRLGEYLVGRVAADGPVIEATHQQIAAELGTSREVVSRMLKDFEMRELLQLRRGRVEVRDLDGLHRLNRLCD